MNSVDKLIEMALDFADMGFDDPYDPETQAAIKGQRVRVYVASTTKHFWDVIQNGMHGIQHSKQANLRKATIFFDQLLASDRAYGMAYDENNQDVNGPVKPLIFVCEKKILRLHKPGASMAAQIAAMAGAIQSNMIDTHIQPRDIVGVVFPAEGHKWAYPIQTFMQKAKLGGFEDEGLPPPGDKVPSLKFGAVTPEDWQHALIRYIQDLLNYSSNYFDYLTGTNQNVLFRSVIVNAAKMGKQRLLQFTPRQMMEWIYSFLPPIHTPEESGYTKEDDIGQVIQATEYENNGRPFWMLFAKYSDRYTYDVLRGKKEPPNR